MYHVQGPHARARADHRICRFLRLKKKRETHFGKVLQAGFVFYNIGLGL